MSTVRAYLHRYWFRFDVSSAEAGVTRRSPLGWGVTAVDRRDAEELLRMTVFDGGELPEAAAVVEDVDVCDLDSGHVRPNMGDPSIRGIWFPRL